jgi:hypothetical protein
MATSVDVNIKIGSFVGATQTGGAFTSGRPSIQTTEGMEGGAAGPPASDIPLLSVNTFTPFISYVNGISPQQDVMLSNIGNATLTVTNLTFSRRGGVSPIFYWTPSAALYNTFTNTASTITILPGSTATFRVAYTGTEFGEQSNIITFFSNSISGAYQVNTNQIINNEFVFNLSPTSYTTTTNNIGERAYVSYVITPTFNGVDRPDLSSDFLYTLTEGTGWKVFSTSTNAITLEFESNDIGNINGTYQATLSISVGDATINLPTTAIVNIDFESNYNLFQWVSPISYHNSLIGISYDVIDNEKTLTIGVGMGGDGSPEYDMGGENYVEMRNLGIGANNIDNPYLYWAEAYRFRNLGTGTAKTYLSGAQDADSVYLYQEKFTEERNYSYYFGNERSFGSMFIVEDDGTGNLTININNIREYSEDEDFNVTLDNLTRAFHYYSGKDISGRIVNLIQYPLFPAISPPTVATTTSTVTPSGETRTNLFRGIDYINKEQVKVAASSSTVGQTTITLNSVTSLLVGDVLYYIDALVVEGRLLKINNINSVTNVVTLSSALTSSINLGSTVGFKNPITAKTSLVKIPS